VLEWKQSQC